MPDPAERVPLGSTSLAVTRLGLGCAALGNLYQAMDDAQASATADAAWGAGVRLFDTAPLYGHGLSERRIGAALRARPREDYVLATKVGRRLVPGRDPEPQLTISPDSGPITYHWHYPGNQIYAPHPNDDGLRWDLLEWTEDP